MGLAVVVICHARSMMIEKRQLDGLRHASRVVSSKAQRGYRLTKSQRDGATALTLTALGLIDQLAALIPPPRLNQAKPPSPPWRVGAQLAPALCAAATASGRDAADDPTSPTEVA